MANEVKYVTHSDAQKWNLFNSRTFKNYAKLPSQVLTQNSSNVEIDVPKSRYTSRIFLQVEITFLLTHASATTWNAVKHRYAPYNIINRLKVNATNLADPINISGDALAQINMLDCQKKVPMQINTSATSKASNIVTDIAASGGATNTIKFLLEVPFQLNKRDYVGLINTTDQNLNLKIKLDIGAISDLFTSTTGYTIGTPTMTVTPLVEAFEPVRNSLPNAAPTENLVDFNVLKNISEYTQSITSGGELIIKPPVGQKYRRILLDFYGSATGTGLTSAQVTNFIMSINQNINPQEFTAVQLESLNHQQCGHTTGLPAGYFVIDFTDQGFINYGSSRDYIETYGLNEFWVRAQIASGVTGTVKVITETLQNLKTS